MGYKHHNWTNADIDIKSGMPDCVVAKKHGMSRMAVLFHRQRILGLPSPLAVGVKIKPSVKYDWGPIDVDIHAGIKNADIMRKYGIPKSTLIKHKQDRLSITPTYLSIPKPTIRELSAGTIIERKRKAMGKRVEDMPAWLQGPAGRSWMNEIRL